MAVRELSEPDQTASPDEIVYLPFSPLALVALVLAVPACLAIANLGFLAFGIGALVFGVIAMRRCEEGRRMSGYNVARIAVFLAVAGSVLGIGHRLGRNYWLVTVARQKAEILFQALRDDHLEEIVCFNEEPVFRPLPGTDLDEYFERKKPEPGQQAPPVVQINLWMTMPPIVHFVADNLEGTHQYVRQERYNSLAGYEDLVLVYRYHPKSPDLPTFDYWINFHRYKYPEPAGVQWRVGMNPIPPRGGEVKRETVTRFNLEPRKRLRTQLPKED